MRETPYLLRFAAALAVVFGSLAFVATASAQSSPGDYGDSVQVVQPKPVLQKGRFSFTPRVGMTVNDAVYRNFQIGANANFHFSERFHIGGVFQWYDFGELIGGPTQEASVINAETGATVDAAYLDWAGGGELGFVPLFGKFALFNRGIIYYDVAVSAGAMWTQSASLANPSAANGGVGGTMSLSTRLFLNDWMAVNVEVRDVLFFGQLSGVSGDVMTHSVTLGMGMSLYLPMGFDYSEETTN